jgi:hypothetical protein
VRRILIFFRLDKIGAKIGAKLVRRILICFRLDKIGAKLVRRI